jgi:prophage regulatory protein
MKNTTIQAPPIMVARDKAAAALGISERTFETLVAQGKLPAPRKISPGRVGWLWRELVQAADALPVSDLPPGPARQALPADSTAG